MQKREEPSTGVERGTVQEGELRRLASIRRAVFHYLLVAGVLAVAGSLVASELAGGNPANRVFSVLLVAGFAYGLWELRRPQGSPRAAEIVVIGVTFASILGILSIKTLTPGDHAMHQQGWHAFGAWAPVLYVLAYLVFGRRVGLRIAIAFYLLAVAVLAAYIPSELRAQDPIEWSSLAQFYLASLLYVPLLHAFSYFVEWHARALSASEMRAELATLDPLTGLPNRLRFFDRLERAIAYARRTSSTFAVYFVDLDGFKQVNDTHGHQMGDDLLVEVARRLRTALRESDTVARIGGDEFTVLTSPLRDEEGAEVVADKLLAACAAPMVLNGQELHVACSVGVARYPGDGQSADQLMARADAAMYEAKQQGGHDVRFASQATAR